MSESSRSRSTDSTAKTPAPDSQARAFSQSTASGGMTRLQQMAGNRMVASLFDDAPAHDPAEREAERVAETVAAHPEHRADSRADAAGARIHQDSSASEMAGAIDAKAFAFGDDIFFNSAAGFTASSGHRGLLAHELAHVLEQRRTGTRRIQRAPLGPTPAQANKPASEADKREFVREAARGLTALADYYRTRIQVARVSKTTPNIDAKVVLPKWKTVIESDLKLIDEKTDARLIEDLKTAYRAMVEAVVQAEMMSSQGSTRLEIYEKYRADIHDSAWPVGIAEPTANQLSDAIPAEERAKIKVITTTTIPTADLWLQSAFSSGRTTLPDITVEFSGSIPANLQSGLTEVGGSLMNRLSVLPLNSTIALALDLTKFGGDNGLFRFTFYQHTVTEGKKKRTEKRLLIERLGSVGMEGLRESGKAWERFRAHGFKFSGMWKDAHKEAMVAATQLIPESQLSMVDGLTFARDTASSEPNEGGHYEVETHTITMYDRVFAQSAVRFGAAGASLASPATYDAAHEIGHAIDRRKYRAALTAQSAAKAQLKAKFGQYEVPGKNSDETLYKGIPNDVMAEFNQLLGKASNKGTDAVVTESGERWQKDDLKNDPRRRPSSRKPVKGPG